MKPSARAFARAANSQSQQRGFRETEDRDNGRHGAEDTRGDTHLSHRDGSEDEDGASSDDDEHETLQSQSTKRQAPHASASDSLFDTDPIPLQLVKALTSLSKSIVM